MIKNILATAVVALLCTAGAQAQSGTKTMAHDGTHHCLLMADDNTWSTLGLSADQQKKAKDLQAKCKAEGASKTGEAGKMDAGKYEKELQAMLTPEQYDQWKKWCTAQHGMQEEKEKK
ncbi:MAG: hypothetical protein JST66_13325 [Bacteroidetes bacterium]|nr:hypothetical protein [Bacteroidota bacterium]